MKERCVMKRLLKWMVKPSGQCALQRRDYELINLEVLLSDTVVWATVVTAAGVILRCLRIIS
jgi:hypothetical protein